MSELTETKLVQNTKGFSHAQEVLEGFGEAEIDHTCKKLRAILPLKSLKKVRFKQLGILQLMSLK